ncbi:MAG: serpin family protein [Candidatus Marinimicrobia bacterium]|jgi:serpin B|nr:serpin family protein [Candidatus Neomarinimicrobiota bacterium]MDP6612289.1 serpin family protein [Candidatus Neomarinimicrobiota bacterium]|tara:strand:+ start:1371 stop:2582 length:1212 start_codon:yes stop_codon:yes gene_type:complete
MIKVLVIIFTLAFVGCDDPKEANRPPPRNLTAAEKSLVSSDNIFGLNVFKSLSEADPDSNLFISPLSISMALGMTLNGANNSTYEAMRNTLELAGLSETEINESYQSLINLLIDLDPKVAFKIANSIWYKEGLPVYEKYIKTNQIYFNAEVADLNFSDPKAVDRINEWVSDNTNKLIKKIIEEIPTGMVMYLINAIYFKGDWRYPFDPKNTRDGTFYNGDGSESTLPMMTRDLSVPLLRNSETTIIDLPYGDSLFTMTIFLPHGDIDKFMAGLSSQKISEWIVQLAPTSFDLTMPRFELEYEKKLNEILSDLGMEIAFDEWRADFSRIMPIGGSVNLYISEVKHKTYIKVDEEGTEAAAITSVGISETSMPPSIVIDRPFIFAIRENHSGTIFFLGKILKLVK